MKKVSVIIPCYNQGQYIEEAVDSVLGQTYENFEIIIVNDGSTEEYTNELLKSYKKPKTRIINTSNQGLAPARNKGIKEAEGEYILPLDADDKIGRTYLEEAVKILDNRPAAGIVYSMAEFFGAKTGQWELPDYSSDRILLENMIFCSAFFRKKDWELIGGYNLNMKYGWEDWDFWLSLIERGREVYRIPEILFYYRVKDSSMLSSMTEDNSLAMYVQAFENHRAFYNENIEYFFKHYINVIKEKNTLIRDRDIFIEKQNREIRKIEREIAKQKDELENQKLQIEEALKILNNIYNSYGWKILTRCRRVTDFLFPENSVRRDIVTGLLKFIIRFWKGTVSGRRDLRYFIDELCQDNDRIILKGWIFSEAKIIKSLKFLLIKNGSLEYDYNINYPLIREDVYSNFGHNNARRSGFSMNMSSPFSGKADAYLFIEYEDETTERLYIKKIFLKSRLPESNCNNYNYDFERMTDEGIKNFRETYIKFQEENGKTEKISTSIAEFPDRLKAVAGIVIYKSDLNLLLKNLHMFARQTIFTEKENVEFDVIILDNDNGRQIEELKRIFSGSLPEGFYDRITYLASENIGFGRGHNRIFYYAKDRGDFDYYLCVNPDGIPHRDMLRELLFFTLRNESKGFYEARQFPVEHPKVYDPKTGETAWVSGCCVMYPSKIFAELSGFDDFFFMYMEDVDISWRAKLAGYGCYTVGNAYFGHFVDEKGRDMSNMKKLMYASGYKLASKYKSDKFKKFAMGELENIMSFDEITTLKNEVKEKTPVYSSFKTEEFMNFDMAFYFSPVRWK